MKNRLIEAREQAEEAVAEMRDGDLKVRAFETILSHLLSAGVGGNNFEPAPGAVRSNTKAKTPMKASPKTTPERILFLKTEGFFNSQRSIAEIRSELKKSGWHYAVTALSGPLQSLVQKHDLRRENVDDGGGRKGWKYSNF